MSENHKSARARRVVSGLDENGKSTIVSDAFTETRVAADAWTLNQIWQATSVPGDVMAENTLGDKAVIPPPPGGYTWVHVTMPPDSEWDYAGGYAGSLAEAGAAESHVDSDEMAGLHQTDSVDIITIISGEMYAVLETTETLLKPGDTFVQRGTRHAWSNRTDQPCVYVSIMVGATR